jgi:tRNA (cytidine32/uridine32-2'-O)-methyltransferase
MKLQNIRIVLIGTTHPGNVGAAARAMLNMGIERLTLVEPQCPIGEIAYSRASGANHVLDNRQTHAELRDAIADCSLVVAATARRRSLPWPELDPGAMVEQIFALDDDSEVALVFGREHSGLSNEELQMCNRMICIPTNPEFTSLNLAAAIQVLCYEIYRGQLSRPEPAAVEGDDIAASSGEIEDYFDHLRRVLHDLGFINPRHPGITMQRLRRLYLRAQLSRNEVSMLRGILSAVDKSRD